jgi:hypothetical protein
MFFRAQQYLLTRATRKSFRPTPELNEEKGAITAVTADGIEPHKLLISSNSEAVAKFSSFRQIEFSTIRDFLAVTCITSARDPSQQVSPMRFSGMSSCYLQQSGDVDRITAALLAEVLDNTLVQGCFARR